MGMTETASRIIARFGQVAHFERTGTQQNPWDPPAATVSHAALVAVVAYDIDHVDGTLILANDLRVLVSVEGLAIEPTASDSFRLGALLFNVIRVSPIAPDGVARFFDVQVRR